MCGLRVCCWPPPASAVTSCLACTACFTRCACKGVGGIDGFYTRSSFELYHQMALINPDNPDELCAKLYQDTGIPVVLMDANDLQRDQLGKSRTFPSPMRKFRTPWRTTPAVRATS